MSANEQVTSEKPIKGGFGLQTTSTGRPSVIPPIKHLPVSFEEFMKDPETVLITEFEENGGVTNY